MTRLINSRPFWGMRPSVEEYAELEKLLDIKLRDEVREAIEVVMFDYSSDRATLDQGVPPSELRKRLQAITKSCRAAATLLGGHTTNEGDYSVVSPPRSWLPREGVAVEARREIHRAFMWRDYELRKQFGVTTQLADLEPGEIAWRLSQVALAAEVAAGKIVGGAGGRPDGGIRGVVDRFLSELRKAGVVLNCRLDPVEGEFEGSFVPVADWLISIGVRAERSTLCQYAAEAIRRAGLPQQKNRARRRTVRS